MSESALLFARLMLYRAGRFELDALDNALNILEKYRKSDTTSCTDPFLQIESLIALAEAREASANLRTILSGDGAHQDKIR